MKQIAIGIILICLGFIFINLSVIGLCLLIFLDASDAFSCYILIVKGTSLIGLFISALAMIRLAVDKINAEIEDRI